MFKNQLFLCFFEYLTSDFHPIMGLNFYSSICLLLMHSKVFLKILHANLFAFLNDLGNLYQNKLVTFSKLPLGSISCTFECITTT